MRSLARPLAAARVGVEEALMQTAGATRTVSTMGIAVVIGSFYVILR